MKCLDCVFYSGTRWECRLPGSEHEERFPHIRTDRQCPVDAARLAALEAQAEGYKLVLREDSPGVRQMRMEERRVAPARRP